MPKQLVSNNWIKLFLIGISFLIGFFINIPKASAVNINNLGFPRLANIFLKTPISNIEALNLAKWDLLVLGMQVQDTNPEIFKILRENNPNIIILAYTTAVEFPVSRVDILESQNGPWHKLYEGIQDSWWLYEQDGDHVSFWPGNQALNITNDAPLINEERFNTYFPRFLQEKIMSTKNWDGIFFDSVWDTASWVNNGDMDFDHDGDKESAREIDTKWRQGMEKIFSETRRRLGKNVILIGNGGDVYHHYLNGRMFESFPNPFENNWEGQIPKYFSYMQDGQKQQVSIVNGDTQNTGNFQNFQDMRFALTSTLLDNGFFSYDWGTKDHSQLWWYDEYNIALGQPTSQAYNLNSANGKAVKEGLWRRDFENGIILVNSSQQKQKIVLEEAFERILGNQDSINNNGDLTISVNLAGQDGIILLKRLSLVKGTSFINGTLAKVFDAKGKSFRQNFYSYTDKAEGGKLINVVDLDKDGKDEIIEAIANRIFVKNQNGSLRFWFFPYSQFFPNEVNFAIGDIDGDGKLEIITGTGQAAGAHVRIFSYKGILENSGFFAYSKDVRHGVRVAVGDLNGDGKMEIITGPGYGAGPQVRIFEGKTGRLLSAGFFAYDPRIRIGMNIAVGDIDNDKKAEIITGAGTGGGPHVRIFNSQGKLESSGFFAFNSKERKGVLVAVADLNLDGKNEIITFQTY